MADTDKLAAEEREKYEAIWRVPDYRYSSPGERHAALALSEFPWQDGDTLMDFGCGSGRAAGRMDGRHGDGTLRVWGCDIAHNCLDAGIAPGGRFRTACLWDLPADFPVTDWGTCFDVMEHIPTERVDDVLRGIWDHVRKGVFFSICLVDDSFGPKFLNKPLHLTVMPVTWWTERLQALQPTSTHIWRRENILFATVLKG